MQNVLIRISLIQIPTRQVSESMSYVVVRDTRSLSEDYWIGLKRNEKKIKHVVIWIHDGLLYTWLKILIVSQ